MKNNIKKQAADSILRSRRNLVDGLKYDGRKTTEGGCGVIGIVGTQALPGRLIIRSCEQMRNRGNGKGGGVAAVGLFPEEYKNHTALHVAYLDESCRSDVEKKFIEPLFDIGHEEKQPSIDDHREADLDVCPPVVHRYFITPKDKAVERFAKENDIHDLTSAADEMLFQNSFRLNYDYYATGDSPRAFVLSQGKDLMILKAVGFAEQVARYYRLEETNAHVWIGHQRYPTRGRVWHPGGAHPFAGLHEALVHNGDFANYHAVAQYLRQRGVVPLFVTDTEVSALLFDLYSRVLGYPLEYVIEALAPTPEGDFERLSKRRQRIYRALQTAHLSGSPDGPWFFIIARLDPATGMPQLIGITDVSMLRPQVFALQNGKEKSFGAIGSEKQAIDAFFEEVAAEDPDVLPVADRYWNARGGSCADGGAFAFTVDKSNEKSTLKIQDKFGNIIRSDSTPEDINKDEAHPSSFVRALETGPKRLVKMSNGKLGARTIVDEESEKKILQALNLGESTGTREDKRLWGELAESARGKQWAQGFRKDLQNGQIESFDQGVQKGKEQLGALAVVRILTFLRDRKWNTGQTKPAKVTTLLDQRINDLLSGLPGPEQIKNGDALRLDINTAFAATIPQASSSNAVLVVDALGFLPEGDKAACRVVVAGYKQGWRKFIVYRCQGDRFIGCGLGSSTSDVRIDVYGSSGDYLGSGVDGAHIYVHGNAQDQVGQILKAGRIVIYGDVGQTFLYGAKGGSTYVMGNAAGRPLINAVGQIRAIINGTSLDYCAESFMAGRNVGDGFVIINGIGFDHRGEVIGLESKYPGNNLFSLASGGACYLNDPYNTVKAGQLNGAEFMNFRQEDWNFIIPYLRLNEELFGLSIRNDLLMVDGVLKWPKEVFRKVAASRATHDLDWSSMPE